MLRNKLFLVTAESCTGGLLGHLITSIAGSSDYYLGGFVAYSNQAKERFLGVNSDTLKRHGAVSAETVREMAEGARRAFAGMREARDIIAVSISGIAGPGGGTADKPVGTVWIGLAGEFGICAEHFLFFGDRHEIKMQSAQEALLQLAAYLSAR